MASHSSSASSEADEPVYGNGHPLSSSLAGLPTTDAANGSTANGKAKSGQLKDFLDLATSRATTTDLSSKLEQKRLEHERQRELQKKAFEEQMRQLEQQQEQEERELLERAQTSNAPADPSAPSAAVGTPSSTAPASSAIGAPARSRSGNDLASFTTPASPEGRFGPGRTSTATSGGNAGAVGAGPAGSGRALEYGSNAKSMPGSRRHSGEIGGEVVAAEGVRRRPREGEPMLNSFLFDDELEADLQNSAWGGKYLQMNTDDDKFPILVRRDSYPGILSASSAALDLAPLSQAPSHASRNFSGPAGRPNASEWPQFQADRHRSVTHGGPSSISPEGVANSSPSRASPAPKTGSSAVGSLPLPISRGSVVPGIVGSAAGAGVGAVSGRNSPVVEKKLGGLENGVVGGSAVGGSQQQKLRKGYSNEALAQLASPGQGFVDSMTEGFSNFTIDPNAAFGAYGQGHGEFSYDGTSAYGGMGDFGTANRFAGLRLEDLQGDMLPLCKDQFGCRYLQKKLEDGNPEHRDMIFNEIFPHFAELMTDPFANYLSQRLLEYSTDEQRDALIESISGELVSISLNMHGTRAVQKMIDYLSTQRQVQSLILALNLNVVTLIKDLNGNHVIQKCLNHLPPEDNQFIYNAVATHCIEVATHRHGCCVLQRCIDHASESQRIQLVTEITYNSLTLVQDAFGNYVVQYVLDLNDNRFIEAIVRQFLGNVSALSAQKFSSNVVEKCIRVADASGRRAIIDELLNKQRLERLLRDSFANYVVQTALDYAEPAQRAQLIETIRPILPQIRNTPYGKRIQSKISRETGEHHHHHRNGPYHGPQIVPGGYYPMHPQPQFIQHHHLPPQMSPDYGLRPPYYAQPPPVQHHHPLHQNGGLGGPPSVHGFAPFPGGIPSSLGMDYPQQSMSNGYSGMGF